MALTPDDARKAFQSAIPRRRDEFAQSVKRKRKEMSYVSNYPHYYPKEILAMAVRELQDRSEMAAERMKAVIASGWKTQNRSDINSAYVAMFNGFNDWQRDPLSDLHEAVEVSFSDVGRNDPSELLFNVRELAGKQVQAVEHHVADLEFLAAQHSSVLDHDAISASQIATLGPVPQPVIKSLYAYDLFLSHASEDKAFVAELANALTARGVSVWFDRAALKLGDSLRELIDNGLKSSRYAAVILSHAFFEKEWPKAELDGLLSRQTQSGTKVILPIWHNLTAAELVAHSPILAGRYAVSTTDGIGPVVDAIVDAISE